MDHSTQRRIMNVVEIGVRARIKKRTVTKKIGDKLTGAGMLRLVHVVVEFASRDMPHQERQRRQNGEQRNQPPRSARAQRGLELRHDRVVFFDVALHKNLQWPLSLRLYRRG